MRVESKATNVIIHFLIFQLPIFEINEETCNAIIIRIET